MAITIDRATKIITVPRSDLVLISGTLYNLDTDWFRLQLKALEESEEGIVFLDTHRHNTEVTIAGVTYARTIEIINGYSITFDPDILYSVRLVGSNNNLFDIGGGILNQNTTQVIPTNSAGLQIIGLTALTQQEVRDSMKLGPTAGDPAAGSVDDHLDEILTDTEAIDTRLPADFQQEARDAMKLAPTAGAPADDSIDKYLNDLKDIGTFLEGIEGGRWEIIDNQMIFRKSDNVTVIATFNLFDADGTPTMENVFERVRV